MIYTLFVIFIVIASLLWHCAYSGVKGWWFGIQLLII